LLKCVRSQVRLVERKIGFTEHIVKNSAPVQALGKLSIIKIPPGCFSEKGQALNGVATGYGQSSSKFGALIRVLVQQVFILWLLDLLLKLGVRGEALPGLLQVSTTDPRQSFAITSGHLITQRRSPGNISRLQNLIPSFELDECTHQSNTPVQWAASGFARLLYLGSSGTESSSRAPATAASRIPSSS